MIGPRYLQAIPWIVALLIGLAAGVGSYTFIYANGASYLTNNSAACANCHVMKEQYDGWRKSSHRLVAGCNDCHTPASFIEKYVTKASNGFRHSFAFTTGDFHEPIRIKSHNREITELSCRRCHQDIVEMIETLSRENVLCVRCHSSVGHMR